MKKNYSEEEYIKNKNINIITDLMALRSEYDKSKKDEYEKYSDVLPMYQEFLEKLSKLIKSLSMKKDALSYSITLDYLIHNGYLSKDNFFIFQKYLLRELKIAPGINVITGSGCCRNTTEFQEKLFSIMNLNGKTLYATTSFNENINHAVNEIEYNDKIYIYDIINHSLYKFSTEYILEDVGKKRPNIYFKPYGDIVFKSKDFYEMEKRLLKFKKMNKSNLITKEEYMDIRNSVINSVIDDEDIIEDFVLETMQLKEDIYSFMNKVPYSKKI